jgi:hypothetical protein
MKVSWEDEMTNIWKNRRCSKPPTSHHQQMRDATVNAFWHYSFVLHGK